MPHSEFHCGTVSSSIISGRVRRIADSLPRMRLHNVLVPLDGGGYEKSDGTCEPARPPRRGAGGEPRWAGSRSDSPAGRDDGPIHRRSFVELNRPRLATTCRLV